MANIATDLKQRFGWAMDLRLEAYEVLPDGKSFVRSDRDERAIGIFKNLRDSVDNIPPSFVEATEALRAGAPDVFEETLSRALQTVGTEPDPASATEFLSKSERFRSARTGTRRNFAKAVTPAREAGTSRGLKRTAWRETGVHGQKSHAQVLAGQF